MKKIFLSIALSVAACVGAGAQQLTPCPMENEVRMGKLDNGLTYYIRHNEQPKERCEFHIAQAVGAILEEDHQDGLAHFLEHMCFNGTKHFPDKDLINYFESVGVNFGGNINAYTSLDETVYRLSDVPTREGILDSALLVMYDWSCAVTLDSVEIDSERGVIREEWRTGRSAARRMWSEGMKKKYPGSQYAKRDVIGDTAVINNFSYQALRDYYKKWYGPDLQCIVIVGDIDVDKMEQKLVALFKDVPERANRGERPRYGLPDNKEPICARYTDKEAQYTLAEVEFKHPAQTSEVKLSQEGYMVSVVNNVISTIIGYRFAEIQMDPNSNIMQGGGWYGQMLGTTDGFQFQAVPKDGREAAAFRDLLTEIERINRYGFTTSEVERAKTEILASYEKSYNERAARRNQSWAQECYRHYLDDSPMPGIGWENDFVKQVMPFITADMAGSVAKEYITEENVVLSMTGKEGEGISIPSEEEMLAIYNEVKGSEISAPVEEEFDLSLVDKAPKAGKIKRETANQEYGTTEWVLSNGMRVVIKPTKFNENQILLSGYSEGGLSKVRTEDLVSAMLAPTVITFNGLGSLSATDIQKALTGKNISLSLSLDLYSEGLGGSSTVKDFEELLQSAYLFFTGLRRDDKAFAQLVSLLETQVSSRDNEPKIAFNDSIQMTMTCHSERTVILDREAVKRLDQERALAIAAKRFAQPADFTIVLVGNIDPNDAETRRLITTWLGGIKGKKGTEKASDPGIRTPKGEVKNYFTRGMSTNTASNRIVYTGAMEYSRANRLNMDAIGQILSTRYLESIREKEGGSYGVGCTGYLSLKPEETATLIMQFDTDPDKQEKLIGIIHKEVMEIVANGPRPDDLQKVKESMLKDHAENLEKNGFWLNEISRFYNYGLNTITTYVSDVNAITAETVQATLKALVEQGNVAEIVMMPEKE